MLYPSVWATVPVINPEGKTQKMEQWKEGKPQVFRNTDNKNGGFPDGPATVC